MLRHLKIIVGLVALLICNSANAQYIPLPPHYVWASPTSGYGIMTPRLLNASDIPTLPIYTYVYNVTSFGTNVGTGGDDIVAINAAMSAAALTGGIVLFPAAPSGYYNICAAAITRPATPITSIIMRGVGSGSGGIRVLPTCASPPITVIADPWFTLSSTNSYTDMRLEIDDLRVDGSCLAAHDLVIQNGNWFSAHNAVFRNVAPSLSAASYDGGSNIIIAGGGFAEYIDNSVALENVNDSVNPCYGSYPTGTAGLGRFPPYNFDVWLGGDSVIDGTAIGAAVANYTSQQGGENKFLGHGWGYGASSSNPFSRPYYIFAMKGANLLPHATSDGPTHAHVRWQAAAGTTGIQASTGVVAAGSGGTPGAYVTLTGTTGTGTKFTGLGYIAPGGGLAAIPYITYGGAYSVMPTNMANEPVTATGGLVGAAISLMAGVYADTSGPDISQLFTYNTGLTGIHGVEFGVGVSGGRVIGNNFSAVYPSTGCFAADAGETITASILFNDGCPSTSGLYLTGLDPGTDQQLSFSNSPTSSYISASNASGLSTDTSVLSFFVTGTYGEFTFSTNNHPNFQIRDWGGTAGTAANYFYANNSPTGYPPQIVAAGTDTNVGFQIVPKGTGLFSSSGPIQPPTETIAQTLALTCNVYTQGALVFVKDTVGLTAAVFGGAVAGGGVAAIARIAQCNGGSWVY